MAQNEASIDEKFFLIKYGTVSQKGGIYMKAKKLVAVGMTVLMLGGLFVGCGNSADTSTGANSGKNVKITIFQSKIEANEGYKKLIAAYEKDHPNVEINLEAVTGNDFGASMKAKMQSDPPTIFSVGGFSDMKDYGDVIEDVSDLDIMQHALEGTTDTFTKDGKVYAIPLYMEGYGFVINKQMFEDAGVSVDSMMNFEGMKAGFDTLKEKIDNGEMKDKYPNLEAVMEYPTKELCIGFFYSLTNWNGIVGSDIKFVGFQNFIDIFTRDDSFVHAFLFTALFSVCAVVLVNLVGFALALLVTQKFRGATLLRGIFFMPNMIGGLLLGFTWQFIFISIFEAFSKKTGIAAFSGWLSNPETGFIGLLILTVWQMSGYMMIVCSRKFF